MNTSFQVEAIKDFDGATILGKQYTVTETSNDGQEWYKVEKTENGYTWIPAHVFKVCTVESIQAIYPPTPGVIPKACYSCGKDVQTDRGFADMDKPPYTGYLCASCAIVAIGGNRCAALLQDAQERYRKSIS